MQSGVPERSNCRAVARAAFERPVFVQGVRIRRRLWVWHPPGRKILGPRNRGPSMSASEVLSIRYHRDFDGMVSAAVLASILGSARGEDDCRWASVNYDQRKDWENFERGRRFAIVDFHFHPRAEYWFDHHPTTFLSPELREAYGTIERDHEAADRLIDGAGQITNTKYTVQFTEAVVDTVLRDRSSNPVIDVFSKTPRFVFDIDNKNYTDTGEVEGEVAFKRFPGSS